MSFFELAGVAVVYVVGIGLLTTLHLAVEAASRAKNEPLAEG